MRELAFLITGLSEDAARKLRRRRSGRAPIRAFGWLLLGAALLYLIANGAKPAVQLAITSPPSGTTTLNPQILIAGNATGIQADAVTLEVNGSPQTVPVVNGSFDAQVSLVLGDNVIRASVNDTSSELTTITRRPQPVIRIESPLDNSHTTGAETEVIGRIENSDDRVVTLDVNGTILTVPVTNERFSIRAPLVVGRNFIRALVTGAAPAPIEVLRLQSGIAITFPSNGYTTDRESVAVSGTVENVDAGVINLRWNESSRNVPVVNDSFISEIALKVGDNRIKAFAGDALFDEIVVHRVLPPVIITLTSPQSGPTQSAVASVRGTIQNARSRTVILRVNGSSMALPLTGSGFATEVRLSIGDNLIQASQEDGVSKEVVVNRLPPPTLIRITSPGTVQTKESSVRVTGAVENPLGDTLTLTVNGSPRSLQIVNRAFASDVELGLGDNRIRATQGNATSNEVVVTRVDVKTLISITSPGTGPSRNSSVMVTGTITNPRGPTITLTVNGLARPVRIANGGFTSSVRLEFGETRIQASQGDAVSNEVVVTRAAELRTVIRITSPESGATKDFIVTVRGTITNARGDVLTLTVNGSPLNVRITDGGFAQDVKLGLGETRIQASQGDSVSNEVVVTRAAELRTVIRIISPRTGAIKDSIVTVRGTITNPRGDTLTLTVNGSPLNVRITDGGFAQDVKLGLGETRIQASQGDAVSNEVVVTRAAELRTVIRIISPRTGVIKDSSVTVRGTITNPRGDTLTLTVNGSFLKVGITDGGFATIVKLSPGDNRIQASQGDAVSNEVVVSRVVQNNTNNSSDTSECSKINCDCKNIKAPPIITEAWSRTFAASFTVQPPSLPASAGAPPQDRQAQCRAAEDKLRQRCKETGKLIGVCPPDASGPNAFPSRKPRSSIPKKQGGTKP